MMQGRRSARPGKRAICQNLLTTLFRFVLSFGAKDKGSPGMFNTVIGLMNRGNVSKRAGEIKEKTLASSVGKVRVFSVNLVARSRRVWCAGSS